MNVNVKDLLSHAAFHLLKIFGCGWLGTALSLIPWNIIRLIKHSNETTKFFDNAMLSVFTVIFAMTFLFLFSFREGRKEGHLPYTKGFLALCCIVPAVTHCLICVISGGNIYLMMMPLDIAVAWAGSETAVTVGQIFVVSLLCDLLYAIALYFGTVCGRRRRVRDKETLTRPSNQ